MRQTIALLVSLILAVPVWAVTIDTTTTNTGAINVLSQTHVTGSGYNRGGVLGCAVRHLSVTLTATYNGVSMTEIRHDQSGSNNEATWIFYIVAPASGSHDWAVTQSGGNSFNLGCFFVTYTDSLQSAPITDNDGVCASSGTSSTRTLTTATNELLIDVIGISGVSVTLSQGSNQTDISGLPAEQGSTITIGGSTQSGADGGVMDWSWTGSIANCMSAVSVGHEVGSFGVLKRRAY